MRVKLPRTCSGQEIIAAFELAATFEEGPNKKWEPLKFGKEFQFEPGSVRQTIRKEGVVVAPLVLEKRLRIRNWRIRREPTWSRDWWTKFTLPPLMLTGKYEEVEVDIQHIYNSDQSGFDHIAKDPSTPQFEDIRPQLERILGTFYSTLQPQTAELQPA